MSEALSAAIEELTSLLEQQQQEVAETKRTINALRRRMKLEPLYEDVSPESVGGPIRPDLYYGIPLSTAAQRFLESRKRACSAEDILAGLKQGGFNFKTLGWKEGDELRSFSISLSKNSKSFHRLPNGTFGLISWYDEALLKNREKAAIGKPAPDDQPPVVEGAGS